MQNSRGGLLGRIGERTQQCNNPQFALRAQELCEARYGFTKSTQEIVSIHSVIEPIDEIFVDCSTTALSPGAGNTASLCLYEIEWSPLFVMAVTLYWMELLAGNFWW